MCQTPSLLLCTTMVWHFLVIVVTCAISSVHCQERVGCFLDGGPFLLSAEIYRNYTHMTIDWCLNVCLTQSGYVYAGLEAGYACLCGNDTDHTRDGPQQEDSECYKPCPGNLSQKCGAGERLEIYMDADECGIENGGCNHECVNSPGSFYCSCRTGYQLVDDERHTCTDVDECAEMNGGCNQECINSVGSYECACRDGYKLKPEEKYNCTGESTAVNLALGILLPSFVVAVVVVGAIIFIRRRKYTAKKRAGDESHTENTNTFGNLSDATNRKSDDNSHESPTTTQHRNRQQTFQSNNEPLPSMHLVAHTTHKQQRTTSDASGIYANVHTNFIHFANLDKYVDDIVLNTTGIEKEYKSVLPCYGVQTEAVGGNWRLKNKYKNIMPYENNRVKLTQNGKPNSGYINASYISVPHSTGTTIAAQGPMTETVDDFWLMVWEENVTIIVMLTNEMENTKRKCAHYWPESDSKQYDNLVIRPIDVTEFPDFVIRRFEIYLETDSNQRRSVHQFQFTTWPDKDVPENMAPLLRFYHRIKAINISGTSSVVHCSAGVGRTGTFIALDWLLRQAKDEHGVDFLKCLHQLREQRMQMIQTLNQYIFLHEIIRDAIAIGETAVSLTDVSGGSLIQPKNLLRQFEILSRIPLLTARTASAAYKPQHKAKNRTDILPSDAGRVRLTSGTSDYINAVTVKGYYKSEHFIATQWPLESTVEDLWRMIHDYKIHAVIVLKDMTQTDGYPRFLPSRDNSHRVGDLYVHLVEETMKVQTIEEMHVIVSHLQSLNSNIYSNVQESQASNDTDQNVCVLSIPESRPLSVEQVVVLNERLAGLKLSSESTLIISRDGGQLCGQYIAVSILLEMIKEANEVDLFHVAQQIRSCRPEFFSSETSYQEFHEIIQSYLGQQV